MALLKEIELENGVILNYHRIVALNKVTNMSNIIEVDSYISTSQREKEQIYQNLQVKNANKEELTKEEKQSLEKGINVFVEAEYINVPYNENTTIEDAYEYLKTTDKYKDAEDV